MRKPHVIFVKGKQASWAFNVDIDPAHLQELRDDGLEVNEIRGRVPLWVAQIGMARPWCFAWDVFHFRSPFAQ